MNIKKGTTKNVYGVYDINGGSYEYVTAYVNNESDSLTSYGDSFVNNITTIYMKNVYDAGNEDTREANYIANCDVYGDAIYETSRGTYITSEDSKTYAWYKNYSYFANSNSPFLVRGGHWGSSGSGLFCFLNTDGNVDNYYSFRLILITI